jgi:hypothetical protein
MSEPIGAVRIDIIGNADDLTLEVQKAKTLVSSMGPEFEKSFAKMQPAAKNATLAALKFEQQIGKSRDGLRLLSLAARGAAPEALEKLRQSMLRTREAADLNGKALVGTGKSAKELQFAMRGLPAQITDIGVSLASGQRPMMVLLQQGGQLKDMFGGIRPAASALAGAIRGLINPYTAAAAAVGLLTLAWKQSANEADAFAKAIILTGNFAGVSSRDLEQMADRVEKVTSATTGAARETVTQVAATGRFTKDQIESIARTALEMKEATGQAVDETIQAFVRIADDPVQAIEALDKSQHLLDDSTKAQIKSLKEQGDQAGAAALAIKAVADETINRANKVEAHLSLWALLWHDIGAGAKTAWDEIVRGINNADRAAASAKSLTQMLATLNPTLGVVAGAYFTSVAARQGAPAEDLGGRNTGFSGGPQFNLPGLTAPSGFNAAAGPWNFANASGGSFGASQSSKAGALRDEAVAAREAQRALAELGRAEAALMRASMSQEDAKSRAIESWADLSAQLQGPVHYAMFQHEKELLDIADAGKAAGASADEIALAQARATAAYEKTTPAAVAAAEAQKQAMEEASRISRGLQFAAEDMFASFIDGSKSASEAFADFARDLQRIAAQVLAEKAIRALFNWFAQLGTSTSVMNPISGEMITNAKGGVYSSPSLSAYSGGVYDRPQMFKFAKGAGIFGEAGPEAIMPLARGRDGKLGVQSAGGGLQVEINNYGSAKVTAREQSVPGLDGASFRKVIIDVVADDVASGGKTARSIKSRLNVAERI